MPTRERNLTRAKTLSPSAAQFMESIRFPEYNDGTVELWLEED